MRPVVVAVLFACLLVTLAATSAPRVVGDGAEYVHLASRMASFLRVRHPSIDNPLPEIFAERLPGLDENWLPVATPGCEKLLLPGRGGRDSVWPMPCAPSSRRR